MRKLLVALVLSLVSSFSYAERVKPIFNALTGKFDYVTIIDSNTIVPGAGVNVSCTNGACTLTASGSAASNLETMVNNLRVSSPTATQNFIGSANGIGIQPVVTGSSVAMTFNMLPGNTNYIQVSSTLQSGSTFYVSSGTVSGSLIVNGNAGNTGNIYLKNLASLAYGTDSPAYIIDIVGGSTNLSPLASITHSSGTSLQVGSSGDFESLSAYNNSHGSLAYAGKFSKTNGSAPSLYSQTASTGIAAEFSAVSGVALNIQAGSARLGSSTITIRGVDMIWPSSGTIGKFLQYASTNTLAWGTPTVSGGGGGSSSYLTKFVLVDSGSNAWEVSVNSSGALITTSVGSIPAGVIARSSIVVQDADFGFWTITVNTSGALVTASGGSPSATISDLLLNDSTNKTWVITVNTSGNLVTS